MKNESYDLNRKNSVNSLKDERNKSKDSCDYEFRVQNLDNLSNKIKLLLSSGMDVTKLPGKITTPRSNFDKMWKNKG